MVSISNKAECTGCSACASVCPQKCISMEMDSEGFLYPKVDIQRCISCDLCGKICPVHFPVMIKQKPLKTLAAISNNSLVRFKSSSGGIFSLLSNIIIEDGGEIWGASFDAEWRVVHQCAQNKNELEIFRGAKYLQSDVRCSFGKIEYSLKKGKPVLFSGTPCQVAGLKKFLRREYKNLYTVDLVCHGVPSFKVFNAFLREQFGEKQIVDISFRDKTTGWKSYNLRVRYLENGVLKKERYLRENNVYMNGFISNLYLRPSCYQCPSKCGVSGSDITLGDFWGIEKAAPEMDDGKGTSLVLLNTFKGEDIFNMIKPFVFCKELPYDIAVQGNVSLEISSRMNPWRKIFFKDIEYKAFSILVRSFDNPSLLLRLRRKIYDVIEKYGK